MKCMTSTFETLHQQYPSIIQQLDISFLLEIAGLQVPCHRWQSHDQPVKFLFHRNLAPQARSLLQPECKIQHIVLVIGWLFRLVEHFGVFDNNMASRAGARATTSTYQQSQLEPVQECHLKYIMEHIRTFHLQVVGLGNIQQIVSLGYLKVKSLAVFVDEANIDPGLRLARHILYLFFFFFRQILIPLTPRPA